MSPAVSVPATNTSFENVPIPTNVDKPATCKSLESVRSPPEVNVDAAPGKPASRPLLAVINPIASTFVTSSYVSVPAIETLFANDALPTNVETPDTFKLSSSVCPSTSRLTPTISCVPSKVKLASSSNSPPVPAITTRLSVRSSTLSVFACAPALISNNPPVVVTPLTFTSSTQYVHLHLDYH